jgi:hypothetical protein
MVLGCGGPQPTPPPLVASVPVDAGTTVHATVSYPPDYFEKTHRDYDSEPDEPDPAPVAVDAGTPRSTMKPCEQIDPTINCNPPRPSGRSYLDLRVIGAKQRPQGGLEIVLAVPDKEKFDDGYAGSGLFLRKDGKLLDIRFTVVSFTRTTVTGIVERREEAPSGYVRIERKARP